MTEEEFRKVPFKMMSHLSLEHEHRTTYVNEDYGFGINTYTSRWDDYTIGRAYVHYIYNDVVYKTRAKFLEAIKDVELLKQENYDL